MLRGVDGPRTGMGHIIQAEGPIDDLQAQDW